MTAVPALPRATRLTEPEMAAWTGFLRAHARVMRRLDRELEEECALSLAQYDVLIHLARAPHKRLRMTDLADQVLLSRSGLTRLVDRLVTLGLVERSACPSDARGVYAVITEEGLARFQTASVVHLRGVREHVIGRLDADEQRCLAATMGKLLDP